LREGYKYPFGAKNAFVFGLDTESRLVTGGTFSIEQVWELDIILHYGDFHYPRSLEDLPMKQLLFVKRKYDDIQAEIAEKMQNVRK
jgi:hypothetical protein